MFIDVNNLSIQYGDRLTVKDVSFTVNDGETLTIVGESGSGKTSIIRALIGCLPGNGRVSSGQIQFDGEALDLANPHQTENLAKISMIFQDSGNMLNPIRTLGSQFVDYLCLHNPTMSKKEAWNTACNLLERVHLHDGQTLLNSYVFELSGGMRQRVGIAMSLALKPSVLLADEPTSALDVTTQAQILKEFAALRKANQMSMILVTHNLGVASYMSHKILILRNGQVVEYGSRDEVLYHPKHEYTKELLATVPTIGGEVYYE